MTTTQLPGAIDRIHRALLPVFGKPFYAGDCHAIWHGDNSRLTVDCSSGIHVRAWAWNYLVHYDYLTAETAKAIDDILSNFTNRWHGHTAADSAARVERMSEWVEVMK